MLILAKVSVTIFDESLMEVVAIEELEFAIKFETPFKQEVIDEVEVAEAVEEVETASETESITETKEDDTSEKPSFAGVSTETKTVKVRQ